MGEFALVEQCSCGSVHLTIGALTLRLAPQSFPALASVLGEAACALVFEQALGARGPRHDEIAS